MGFASSGACFPTSADALADWCAHVEPGSNAMSCSSCTGTECSVTYLNGSGVVTSTQVPVATPSCTVPTPVDDALAYSGAIVLLWVAVYAVKQVINLFRVPHADAN